MSAPLDRVLPELEKVKRSGDGWVSLCPAHEDKTPSLSVALGSDGRVLLNCHAGCAPAAIAAALGLELKDLFPDDREEKPRMPDVVAVYPYHDEGGEVLYEALRYEPKDFRQRRPDGRGGWVWSVKGVRKVPYRLPAVLGAVREGRAVFVVEGEKDVDRLAREGLVATCNVGGAGKWGDELCEPFRGARVIVVPDNDDVGRRHAEEVAGKLSCVSLEARILSLPDLPPKGDVSDWLSAGHTAEELKTLARSAPPFDPASASVPAGDPTPIRKLPPALSVRELMEEPEPEESWIAEGLIPGDANILMAAYPKSYKTFTCLELAVSAIVQAPFLGRFRVPREHRVGMILMEGSKYRSRVRLDRICQGKGHDLEDLDGAFHFWFRPPLKLSSPSVMAELTEYVTEYDLDLLMIDNWSYVASGNSNDSDEVTPQLDALSRLREARPGLSTLLVHHARKTSQDGGGDRLTDVIRNSSAFGAWYDLGLVLSRKNEQSPVTVRAELRDHPSPEPFAFTVEDEVQPGPESGQVYPSGWLKLLASERSPAVVQMEDVMRRMMPAVADFVKANQGCSKERVKNGITGDNGRIIAAFDQLCREGFARYQEPKEPGKAGACWLNYDYPSRAPLSRFGTPPLTPLESSQRGTLTPADPAGTPLAAGSAGSNGRPHPAAPHGVGASGRAGTDPPAGTREDGLWDRYEDEYRGKREAS